MGIKLSLNVTYCLVLLHQFEFVHFPMRGSGISTCSTELNREKTSDLPPQSSETALDGASSSLTTQGIMEENITGGKCYSQGRI